jgi:hypothetical protein
MWNVKIPSLGKQKNIPWFSGRLKRHCNPRILSTGVDAISTVTGGPLVSWIACIEVKEV